MYKVEFEGLSRIYLYLRVVFLRAFHVPASRKIGWNLSDWILDFCAKTFGLITWLVYPITESRSLTQSIHRNYHFTNPMTFSNESKLCIGKGDDMDLCSESGISPLSWLQGPLWIEKLVYVQFLSMVPIDLFKNALNLSPRRGMSWVWHYIASANEAPLTELCCESCISSLSWLQGPLWIEALVYVQFLSMVPIDLLKNHS